ncbi:MAG: ABC transporter substrate-binding protein [Chloroflexi bacterium]|nr:MAG: ABC transporter substrate-binding protein [Chloroflexota bacterium]
MRVKGTILATIMLVTAACNAGAPAPQQSTEADITLSGPVAITLWHALSGPQQVALDAMVKKFNDTNGKGITVTALNQGNYTVLGQKLMGAIQAGSLPELAHAYESNVADYMKAATVVDLGPYKDSKVNGLAVMYVNEDILKELGKPIPKTWDEFEATAAAAVKKDASGKTTRYGFGFTTDASYFNAQVYSRGGSLMAADNQTVAWNGKEGLQVLQMYDRMNKNGSGYTPAGFDWQNDLPGGKLLFYFSTTSSIPFLKDIADKTGAKWSIANLPQTDTAKPKTVQFGANVAIFKSTAEKQLASWLFIKWMSETDQSAQFAATSYYMPVRKSAADAQILKDYWAKVPQGRQGFDLIQYSSPEPNVRGQQDVRNVVTDMMTSVLTAKATPDAAIKAAGDKANAIFKDNQ